MSKGIGTRLHRLDNIYQRTKSLLVSGIVKHENRPLWYDVYEAFPPVKEPKYVPDPPSDEYGLTKFKDDVRKIFYEEDWARAMVLKNKLDQNPKFRKHQMISLLPDEKYLSFSQRFVDKFRSVQDSEPHLSKEEVFVKTHNFLLQEGSPPADGD